MLFALLNKKTSNKKTLCFAFALLLFNKKHSDLGGPGISCLFWSKKPRCCPEVYRAAWHGTDVAVKKLRSTGSGAGFGRVSLVGPLVFFFGGVLYIFLCFGMFLWWGFGLLLDFLMFLWGFGVWFLWGLLGFFSDFAGVVSK